MSDDLQPITVQKGRKTINLKKVAFAQRWLVLCVLGMILIYAGAIFNAFFTPPAIADPIQIALGLLSYAVGITAIVFVAMLAFALGTPVWLLVVLILLMIMPCVNFLILLITNGRATAILKQYGLKVGLLGVPPSEHPKLYANACAACGYNLAGNTTGLCPECGTPIIPRG